MARRLKHKRRDHIVGPYAKTACGMFTWADETVYRWTGVDCVNCLKDRSKRRTR